MIRRTLVAIFAACAISAQAGVTLKDPEMFWRPWDNTDPRALRVGDRMAILDTGDITFAPGATINTGVILPRAGICVGYMVVRVNGEPMLVPVYQLRQGDTPPPEFEREFGPIRNTYIPRDC